METTITLIVELIVLFKQLHIAMEARNLWTMAAMTALLFKGCPAHLYALGKALPCKGKLDSRVQKLRRWVSNPKITPQQFIAARLRLLAPLLTQLPEITLIIDRTEWTRRGTSVNLFLCSIAFHGRSFPIHWIFLPTRGCSSLEDQKPLLTPVLHALAAHPQLAHMPTTVVADREFCSPTLPRWLKSLDIHFSLRVKKHDHVSRSDMPSTPLRDFFAHCQRGTYYFFRDVRLTEEHHFPCHVFLFWREDCQEPLALITDREEASVADDSYHERMFIETLNRDLKSSGYDIERGKMTDLKRLDTLLIPIAFAYILSVIQGHVEELIQPVPPLKKRTLSLFTKARHRMIDLLERTPLPSILQCFEQFFQFLSTLLLPKRADMVTHVFRTYARQQALFLEGIP
jgi:hypothetical protein